MNIVISIVTMVLYIGCTSTSNNQLLIKKETTVSKTLNWILNPELKNKICAIGSSAIQEDMKKIAKLKAKSNISKEIKIYIETQSIKKTTCTSQNCKSDFTTSSIHQSSNLLKNIKLENEYLDKKNNIYYIRLCTETNLKPGEQI